jgi:hypothetical protein
MSRSVPLLSAGTAGSSRKVNSSSQCLDSASRKEQMRQGMARLRGEASRRIEAILTRRQDPQFQRMLGEPFDFSKLRRAPAPR